jgi:asparagine synthase (glutamine-hydrolysing)
MCGICGEIVLTAGERVVPDSLLSMRAALEHRGPDGAGLYVNEDRAAGLAFRRLRIIDLSPSADQPMSSADQMLQVVFNGEIYNFKELRKELTARGHRFRTQSDTETIIYLYQEEGVDAFRRLDGMFAVGIWDARKRCLVLARDRAGKKPLFVYRDARRIAFASEIKALFAHPAITVEIDPDAIPAYLTLGHVPSPSTFYRGVEQVAPATVVSVNERGDVQTLRYWTLPSGTRRVPEQEARADVARLVTRAVEKRLVSDVPLGAFLSGGLDSTIVVGLMTKLTNGPVKTFSIGFEGDAAYDETRYARLAVERFGSEHTEFHVSPGAVDLADLVDRLIWHHDGPFGDSSAIPTYLVAKLTRQHVTVALTGDGSDELFAGYLRFQAAAAAERMPAVIARVLRATMGRMPRPANDRHWLARAQRFARFVGLPLTGRLDSWSSPYLQDVPTWLTPEFRSTLSGRSLHRSPDAATQGTPLARALRHNFETYLLDDLLVKADRCSMASSLEVRSPFLDRDVIQYVTTLPDALKLSRGQSKRILRETFADLVPREILTRKKMGFGVPLGRWFGGQLRPYLADVLLAGDAKYRAYLSGACVEDLVRRHDAGENRGHELWNLLCFERWLQLLPGWTSKRAVPVTR